MKDKIVLIYKGKLIDFCCPYSLKVWVDDTEPHLEMCDACKANLDGEEEI